MHYNDPRHAYIKNATHDFMKRHFECIPSILFETLVQHGMEYDQVLELVDTKYRTCPECDNDSIECGKLLDDDDEHSWECTECKAHYPTDDDDDDHPVWEHLALSGPTHAWPGAHGTVFWTTWNAVAEHAAQCGFEVYESPMFNGYILAIDGGGYDFVNDHWMPLYLAMDIRWHEHEPGWMNACIESDATDAARKAIEQGFKGNTDTAEPFVADLEHFEKEFDHTMTEDELKHWTHTWRTWLKNNA